MARFSLWIGPHPPAAAPDDVDPELWEIFQARGGSPNPELLQSAEEIRLHLKAHLAPGPSPEFQARLRANLMREARASTTSRVGPRRLALPLFASLGIAGVAAAAVVVASVVAIPLVRGQVRVKAPVAGHRQVPVTQAIRISFNRPMDEAAVVQGLTIKPAVSYQASWPNPKTLVISPAHGLAPNVGYVVTIPQPDVKAQNGAVAPTDVVIPFGTGSVPSTPQGQIPTVVSVTHVAITEGVTSLSYMPDGALLVLSSGTPAAVPSSAQSPSPSPTATPATPSLSGLSFGTLYVLSPSLQPVANDAEGAVASPDSQEIAYWTPGSQGTLDLEVVAANGSGTPETLATSAESDPGLAWLDNGDLLYAAAGQLRQVSLDGQVTAVDPGVQVDPSGFFTLSPSAQAIFASPGGVPTLYSLPSGTATTVSGLVGVPAWSATGTALTYISASDGTDAIELTSDLGVQNTVLFTAPAGVQLSGLSFDPTGTYLTYVSRATGELSQLNALDVQSKVSGTLGTLGGVSNPLWAPTGDQLSTLVDVPGSTAQTVESLLLSGGPQPPAIDDTAADSALGTGSSLAQLQVTAGPVASAEIGALLAPGTSFPQSVLLPGKFDRFYAVSTTATSAGSTTYTVSLHLVRDATSTTGPAYLPETVTVQTRGASPLITNISPGVLTPVPTGPLVTSVSATNNKSGTTVFAIHFDSDLNPLTVGAQSITLSVGGHIINGAQFNYSALTRTETVTVNALPVGAVTLTVESPLSDIDNTPMQSAYQVVLQPQPATAG
ncbi:MAG: Ig-like domain-containing protein [Candidatus Dormiibacterota bacterium]